MVACVIGVFFLSVNRPLFSAGGPVKTTDLWPLFPGLGWPLHPGPNTVKNGKVYLVPSEPYSFIDNPPATNRLIGIYWLGNLLYPELYPVDIIEKTQEYYSLFYRYDLSREQAESILRI